MLQSGRNLNASVSKSTKTLDPRTLKYHGKRLKVKTGKPGTMTIARLKAGQNPRSSYSMYIMLESYAAYLFKYNIWNSDGTQLTCAGTQ
jgi:hypothetical protein